MRIVIIILLIAGLIFSTGCVEVTPPTGTQNASAYASTGTGSGNLTENLGTRQPTQEPGADGSPAPATTQEPQPASTQSDGIGPEEKLPSPPDVAVVQVTPRSYEGLPSPAPTEYYSARSNKSAIGPGKEFVTIYEFNHSFTNDAVAYAFNLQNPPLYIDLQFSPVIGTDIISFEKRTGDKEGQIDVTVNRPLKDAWFEMRVYNQDGLEITREGYGKTYSQDNKTVTLRSSGSYQFDFVGNKMNATVVLKVPMSESALARYGNLTGLLADKKAESELIPEVQLLLSDLPPEWQQSGEVTRNEHEYQSVFVHQASGYKLHQTIKRFESTQAALSALSTLKSSASGDNPSTALIGQEAFQYETVRKTGVAYVQGLYLVDLVSYSVPALPVTELQRYGGIILSRITSL
jgi:hypothetical protein